MTVNETALLGTILGHEKYENDEQWHSGQSLDGHSFIYGRFDWNI